MGPVAPELHRLLVALCSTLATCEHVDPDTDHSGALRAGLDVLWLASSGMVLLPGLNLPTPQHADNDWPPDTQHGEEEDSHSGATVESGQSCQPADDAIATIEERSTEPRPDTETDSRSDPAPEPEFGASREPRETG